MDQTKKISPLSFKPDLEDANKRWEAFYMGELIDRPVTCVRAPKRGYENKPRYNITYRDRVLGDIDDVIDKIIQSAENTFYGGEAIPAFMPTFGPDEIASYCGGELCWGDDATETNWSRPFVDSWEKALPLRIKEDNPLWLRMQEFFSKASKKMANKMLITPIDLHSNMDLLAAVRGSERLCMDLIDCPDMIDKAMESARSVFPVIWNTLSKAGKMDEYGYFHDLYSMDGAAMLQCDFSIMMSPDMFDRWVLPALEEEAEIVRHPLYHWDGVGALRHFDSIMSSKRLNILQFVPGSGQGKYGNGDHIDFISELKAMQEKGKAVQVWGTPEQIKFMHRELKHEKVFYCLNAQSQDEAESLLEWLKKNT